MKKFLVIEGRVHPEHYISDMGVTVPYQGEVLVLYEKARWSRDLSQALHNKSVVRKRVVTLQDSDTSLQKRLAPSTPKSTPPAPPSGKVTRAKVSSDVEDKSSKMLEKSLKENEHLRLLNKELTATTNKLLDKQDQLIDKLTEYLSRPVPQVVATTPSASHRIENTAFEEDEDIPTFIPSKIRSGKAKSSENSSEVTTEAKEASSQLSDAASALKALRKGKSNDA